MDIPMPKCQPPKPDDNDLTDLCSEYITDKDCSYLAKEGLIVRYMSITGRKSDFIWHKYTIVETLRIIKAMRANKAQSPLLREHHLITAFQEMGKVYEFGAKSRHVMADGVFNYTANSEMSLGDEAMALLVEKLQLAGYHAVLMNEVIETFEAIDRKLNLKLAHKEMREMMMKHFENAGYVWRVGAYRPLVYGRKQNAIMMKTTKPADVLMLPLEESRRFISSIYGELI